MNCRLAEILAEKRKEVDVLKKAGLSNNRSNTMGPIRDFKSAISVPDRISLIAEIKFASPSAGTIREKVDPCIIGRMYDGAGAAAISLLTDKKFFQGDLRHLPRLKKAVSLPILRKDFIIDELQVVESFLYGADAVLLIARIVSRKQLKRLLATCQELGLDALIEVHDRDDLEKAITCRAKIIGINNRNLATFEVDINTTLELAPLVPDECIVVSESGINDERDIRLLNRSGAHAVLVGTSIMKSDDHGKKVKELVKAGRMEYGAG